MNRSALAGMLAAVAVLTACEASSAATSTPTTQPSTSAPPTTSAMPSTTSPSSTAASTTSPATARRSPASAKATATTLHGAAAATKKIRELTESLGSTGVSVEAYRLDNGATYAYGATSGMATASTAKLFILETLLLQHQDAHTSLTESQRDLAKLMITESDNAAADELYEQIGEGKAFTAAAKRLGVTHLVPGDGIYWGFTSTSAADFVALLRDLTSNGPLTASSRDYVTDLLSEVESDQHWGVSAAADKPAQALLKNGWLASGRDSYRWIVDSVGIVRVDGHRVLLAVLTQHNSSFDGGIDLVEQLARISAAVVA